MVYIEGKLRTRSWEKDGVTRYTTEIVGDNMNMLSPKGSSDVSSSDAPGNSLESQRVETPSVDIAMNDESDDLPF